MTLKHAKEWKEAQEAAKPKKESEKKQQVDSILKAQTVQHSQLKMTDISSSLKVRKWEDKDPRSQRLDDKIFRMIVMDLQPWTMVEDSGFVDMLETASPEYRLKKEKFYRFGLDSYYNEAFDAIKHSSWFHFSPSPLITGPTQQTLCA